jgi:hypothetical protein
LKGDATPNGVTWFLWALVPLIAGAAQWCSGVGIWTLVVLSVGAGPAGVVLASFATKTGSRKLGRFDYMCSAYSLASRAIRSRESCFRLSGWSRGLPTLRKAWLAPATEG